MYICKGFLNLRENDKYLSCIGGIMLTVDHGITSHIKIRGFGILSENWSGACLHDVNHVLIILLLQAH